MNKQVLYIIAVIILVATSITGCRKKLAELYYDPDQTTQPSIEKFFTQMINNNRVRPSYWEMRTFVVMHTGIYTQSVGYLNSITAYQQNANYTQDKWNDFYRAGTTEDGSGGVMALYRLIEKLYGSITNENEKANMKVFLMAARVVLYDQLSQIVDMWGDVPYSEAGSVNTSDNIVLAKFDDATDIYNSLLDGLKDAADYFSNLQISTTAQVLFRKQDIMLGGQLDKWQRYANSIRLRLLMRISYNDEPKAKAEVLNMLNDPAKYPLADGATNYSPATTDILLPQLDLHNDDLHLALTEVFNYSAPDYLLNTVMKPCKDPRIPVLFDKYGRTVNNQFIPNTDYNGLPVNLTAEAQQQSLGSYSILDSATFLYNTSLPGIIITASEVNFLKAEAFERWEGGDAAAAYETAIRQSIVFYYYLNSLNKITRTPLTPPAATDVETFLQTAPVTYTGSSDEKLAKIWVQKWAHFGFLQSIQSWAEYRRTKHPQLKFYPSTLPGYELPPSRLIYPASETAYNANYASVKHKDIRTGKIFWDVK